MLDVILDANGFFGKVLTKGYKVTFTGVTVLQIRRGIEDNSEIILLICG